MDLADILASDPSAEARHKTVAVLARFVGRDGRAAEAIARATQIYSDAAIRQVTRAVDNLLILLATPAGLEPATP